MPLMKSAKSSNLKAFSPLTPKKKFFSPRLLSTLHNKRVDVMTTDQVSECSNN